MRRLEEDEEPDLSLRSLAREVGVSPTAVYRHFADKAELTGAIAEQAFERLTEAFESACPKSEKPATVDEAIGHLTRLGACYLDFAVARPLLFQLMFGTESAAYRNSRFSDPSVRSASFSYLVRALDHLSRTGAIGNQPSEEDAMAAWALIHGLATLIIGGVNEAMPQTLEHAARDAAARIVRQTAIS